MKINGYTLSRMDANGDVWIWEVRERSKLVGRIRRERGEMTAQAIDGHVSFNCPSIRSENALNIEADLDVAVGLIERNLDLARKGHL